MIPDIDTRFITLIGTPLRQSYAARMQNAAYRAANLNFCYFYTEAGNEHLTEIISGIRSMPSFAGCAVTKPNKVAVLPLLDELSPLCKKMGACNTVVRTAEGRLIGYNTDGEGFYRSICEELGRTPHGLKVFCMGAGGAGRAICSVLANAGISELHIMDCFVETADALAADLCRSFQVDAAVEHFGDFSSLCGAELVINATGIGMGATIGKNPFPKELLHPEQLCFDACYNPEKTQFLLDAEAAGCRAVNGLNMSLYQGAAQIELWTGKPAPVEAMREELRRILQEEAEHGNNC